MSLVELLLVVLMIVSHAELFLVVLKVVSLVLFLMVLKVVSLTESSHVVSSSREAGGGVAEHGADAAVVDEVVAVSRPPGFASRSRSPPCARGDVRVSRYIATFSSIAVFAPRC